MVAGPLVNKIVDAVAFGVSIPVTNGLDETVVDFWANTMMLRALISSRSLMYE